MNRKNNIQKQKRIHRASSFIIEELPVFIIITIIRRDGKEEKEEEEEEEEEGEEEDGQTDEEEAEEENGQTNEPDNGPEKGVNKWAALRGNMDRPIFVPKFLGRQNVGMSEEINRFCCPKNSGPKKWAVLFFKIILEKSDIKTLEAIKNFECKIVYQSGRGYGNALIEGIKNVETNYLCIFNADGSFDPKYLDEMLKLSDLKSELSDLRLETNSEAT